MPTTMTPTRKPTIVLIPGAWHTPFHYQSFLQTLQAHGFRTICRQLPSIDPADASKHTLSTDVNFVRNSILLPELNGSSSSPSSSSFSEGNNEDQDGNDVILLMHSYGGIVGCPAAAGLGRADRDQQHLGQKPGAEGRRRGAVVGLLGMSASLIREGTEGLAGVPPLPFVTYDKETGLGTVNGVEEIFYNGLPEQVQKDAVSKLKPQAYMVSFTPSPPHGWGDAAFDGRRAYIKCTHDNTIPPDAQDAIIQNTGVEWRKFDLPSCHSPWLQFPDEMRSIIEELAGEWAY